MQKTDDSFPLTMQTKVKKKSFNLLRNYLVRFWLLLIPFDKWPVMRIIRTRLHIIFLKYIPVRSVAFTTRYCKSSASKGMFSHVITFLNKRIEFGVPKKLLSVLDNASYLLLHFRALTKYIAGRWEDRKCMAFSFRFNEVGLQRYAVVSPETWTWHFWPDLHSR
jgi:hypothetical protein